MPFYILPTVDKIAFLKTIVANPRIITRETEGLLPVGWGLWGRILLGIITSTGQIILLAKWKGRILGASKPQQQNITLYNWLFVFSMSQLIFYFLVFVEFAFHFFGFGNLNYLVIFTISATILFVCISLLVRPTILYGFMGWLQYPEKSPAIQPDFQPGKDPEPTKKYSLSIEQGNIYKAKLEEHFQSNLPFKKNGYTIGDLSVELDIPIYQLSAYINQEYGKNFNELINEWRIKHLEYLISAYPEFNNFTLEAMGREVGFNTRSAFISAVKRKTGQTPSEYFVRKSTEKTA